jgi:hypothetical protein
MTGYLKNYREVSENGTLKIREIQGFAKFSGMPPSGRGLGKKG